MFVLAATAIKVKQCLIRGTCYQQGFRAPAYSIISKKEIGMHDLVKL